VPKNPQDTTRKEKERGKDVKRGTKKRNLAQAKGVRGGKNSFWKNKKTEESRPVLWSYGSSIKAGNTIRKMEESEEGEGKEWRSDKEGKGPTQTKSEIRTLNGITRDRKGIERNGRENALLRE